jgi:hypothetical protein
MDGLAAISSRISEITGQLNQLSASQAPRASAPTAGTTATTGRTSSASSFADVLAGAVQGGSAAAAGTGGTGGAGGTGAAASGTPGLGSELGATGRELLGLGTTKPGTAGPATARPARTDQAGTVAAAGAPRATGRTSTGPTSTGPTTGPSRTGRLTASGAPADLARYGNGRIPASALESIGGGHRLWAPAADAFGRLKAAAHRAGVSIGVTDSYRSYAEQVDVARRKGLHSQGGLAAKPGTSEHGWGKSLDLHLNSEAQRWMRRHADDFGFTENVSREPWHWTYAAR